MAVLYSGRFKRPVVACLACAGWTGSNNVERRGSPPEPPGTRKACHYGSTRTTFQSLCLMFAAHYQLVVYWITF